MTDANAVTPSDTGADLAVLAARSASDMKASNVLVLDVGDVLSIAGYFVIASASNPRLVRAVVDDIEAKVKSALGRAPVRTEGIRENQWSLIDYGDVVVHVFLESVREFYEIERLYMEAPRLEWEPPAAAAATS
ncbi:MAG TPA: ribosome silencing factor [Ilumatobacteraceae bacterium]|nr:ribosome silencing factor [Ilumatobacteraceae bacterium]